MTRSLHITSVRAESFGGLKNRQLVLPDHPFVVVMGNNEAGKSSMATLMSWLLVGPHGKTAFALRFGDPKTTVSGHLEALLGDVPVTAKGSFVIKANGAPSDGGLKIAVGGSALDLAPWRDTELRGIDSSVVQAIYAMSGADLHLGENVHSGISALAVAGMAGAERVPGVLEFLKGQVFEAIDTTREGGKSYNSITGELKAPQQKFDELKREIDDYQTRIEQFDELNAQLLEIPALRKELERERTALDAVRLVQSDRRRIKQLSDDLARLPDISSNWRAVVAASSALLDCIGKLSAAEEAVVDAEELAASTCRELGLSEDEGRSIKVYSVDVAGITELVARFNTAVAKAASTEEILEQRTRDDAHARRTLDEAHALCDDIDRGALASIRLDATTEADIVGAVTLLDQGERRLEGAVAAVYDADAKVRSAIGDDERARDDWARFNPHVSAEEWLMHPVGRAGAPSGARANDMAIAFALAAAVTLVAVFALDRVVAGVVTVVSFLAAFAIARMRKPQGSEVVVADDPLVWAAAEAVRTASGELVRLRSEAEKARAGVDGARRDLTSLASKVDQAVAAAGFTSTGSAADHRRRVERVRSGVTAAVAVAKTSNDLATARADHEHALGEVDTVAESLRARMSACGVPARFQENLASIDVVPLQAVTQQHSDLGMKQDARDGLHAEFVGLTAPIADDISGLDLDAVRHLVDDMVAQVTTRDGMVSERDNLQAGLDDRIGSSERARAIIDEDLDDVDLQARLDEVEAEREQLEARAKGLAQRAAVLKAALGDEEKKERLAALRLEIGELEEARDQRLLDGIEAQLAATVLAEVAEVVRQRNQPALVKLATKMVHQVAPMWNQIRIDRAPNGDLTVAVGGTDGSIVPVSRLSTGAQGVLYLALRLAAADQDAVTQRKGLRFPIICDDPLVHLDDERAAQAASLLRAAADNGHQVILFTCNSRTETLAEQAGAVVERFG